MRLSPAFLVSSNSFASFRLLAAMASRGDKAGGTSPSKCWTRGEKRAFLDSALLAREESLDTSMKFGRAIPAV